MTDNGAPVEHRPLFQPGHGRQSIVKLINHEDGEPHFSDERSGVLSIQLI